MAEVSSQRGRKRRRRHQKGPKSGFKKRDARWKSELKDIERITAEYEGLEAREIAKFTDLPLSPNTLDGLKSCGYSTPTEIQREAIPLTLNGRDILGAAKTGSGKTLAFLVPVLELLWRERWTSLDGIGALVISPTRELAYQTFEVLRKVGCRHDFSAGLVIGGKDVAMEKERINHMNILVCTPGRLLQHMDQTANFDCASLKILVLDEADRILDLGFERTMNAIVENLPTERQTLLFSATQTKSVRDLARLSLSDPEYVAVHEHSASSTPHRLSQSYIVCELQNKLCVLYSFLRSHTSCKIIVFISSCKQVKFIYEAFRRLRPGVSLMALYGRQKQLKRVAIYNDFCRKKAAILFCTDIAARGLDFPAVDWVVQLDCPEDSNTYIHRVGRTARYEKDGKALLFLLPSEEQGMLEALKAKKIPIEEIKVNPKKMVPIQGKLDTFCAQDLEMKHWAQRSFICYLRSVHLQSNKQIFDIHKLPTDEYAHSLGLAQPPRIRFLQRAMKAQQVSKKKKTKDRDREGCEDVEEGEKAIESDGGSESESVDTDLEDSGEENDTILKVKRVIQPHSSDEEEIHVPMDSPARRSKASSIKIVSKSAQAKKLLNKKIKINQHIKFDEDGEPVDQDGVGDKLEYLDEENINSSSSESEDELALQPVSIDEFDKSDKRAKVGGIKIEKAKELLRSRDKVDRKRERERIRAAHRERKLKLRQAVKGDEEREGVAMEAVRLAGTSSSEEEIEEQLPSELEGDEQGGAHSQLSLSEGDGKVLSSDEEAAQCKRQKLDKSVKSKKKSKRRHEQLGAEPEPTSLVDDEELALHLLMS